MDKCIGIITVNDGENKFGELCKNRPSYMLPFAGRYRLIDFSLSNMVNHGIGTIAVYTGQKIRSTINHVGDGKPWDLNRRINGLFLFPPIVNGHIGSHLGDISQYYSTLEFFTKMKEEYIYFCNPNIIAKIDIENAFKYFLKTKADITLIYKRQSDPLGSLLNSDKVHIKDNEELESLGVNLATEESFNYYIGMGFMKKNVFIKILEDSIERGGVSYLKDAFMLYKDQYNINTYEHKGHVETIRDIKSFYEGNMNLLDMDISREIFFDGGYIYTKSKDEPPTLYKESSDVKNSLIANGCIVEGRVENSIVFRGVKIGKNAIVKNSIIMQKSEIEDDAVVVNSILDKLVNIDSGINIAGSTLAPYVVGKYEKIKKE